MATITKEDIERIITDEYISTTWDFLSDDPRGKMLRPDQYELAPYHRLIYHVLKTWKVESAGRETALNSLAVRVLDLKEDPAIVTSDILTKISDFLEASLPS